MTSFLMPAAGVLSLVVIGTAALAQTRNIGWDELSGPTTPIENPFETLSNAQMDRLAQLLRLDMLATEDGDTEAATQAKVMRGEFTAEGIDADFLFAERLRIMAQLQAESTASNPEIIGESIRLPGYLLPLEMEGEKAVEFLLVPTVGACIHTPPPPANQIVRVSYPDGFPAEGFYTPIWITGALEEELVRQSLFMVDGDTEVDVTYQMKAETVELYEY
ncbi:hypothetical protein SAMN04488037_103164 [Shimia marina]|uniref:DUF3299 domain-containing protein n=2 Tax=Shimia marina TaxID=321267 RepID=A0A0P1FER7_9RHOB|nr:hypothetical protein SHM7688_02360 [Shimia marina]SFD90066.1 hypothetical protein SAMN04488037_103164 [Shimia marina]